MVGSAAATCGATSSATACSTAGASIPSTITTPSARRAAQTSPIGSVALSTRRVALLVVMAPPRRGRL